MFQLKSKTEECTRTKVCRLSMSNIFNQKVQLTEPSMHICVLSSIKIRYCFEICFVDAEIYQTSLVTLIHLTNHVSNNVELTESDLKMNK